MVRRKVEKAIEVYNKFFSDESTEDIETYIIKETLIIKKNSEVWLKVPTNLYFTSRT